MFAAIHFETMNPERKIIMPQKLKGADNFASVGIDGMKLLKWP
jgi:hypothetical protein